MRFHDRYLAAMPHLLDLRLLTIETSILQRLTVVHDIRVVFVEHYLCDWKINTPCGGYRAVFSFHLFVIATIVQMITASRKPTLRLNTNRSVIEDSTVPFLLYCTRSLLDIFRNV